MQTQKPRKPQKEVEDVLRDARRIIAEKGWTQGVYRSPYTGGYCLVGALECAQRRTHLSVHHTARDLVWDTIWEQYPLDPSRDRPYVGMAGWNDMPGRTKDEVLAVLDKTILKLEESV